MIAVACFVLGFGALLLWAPGVAAWLIAVGALAMMIAMALGPLLKEGEE